MLHPQAPAGSRLNDPRRFHPGTAPDLNKTGKLAPAHARLDDAQRELVIQGRKLALHLARRWGDLYPRLAEPAIDAAVDALHDAALSFDPGRGASFSTYLWNRVTLKLRNVARNNAPLGYRETFGRDAPKRAPLLEDDHPPATDGPASRAVEDADLVGTLLGRMEPTLAEVLRERHLNRKTCEQLARERGVSKQRIGQIEAKALDQARTIARDLGLAG